MFMIVFAEIVPVVLILPAVMFPVTLKLANVPILVILG